VIGWVMKQSRSDAMHGAGTTGKSQSKSLKLAGLTSDFTRSGLKPTQAKTEDALSLTFVPSFFRTT
jgi:hypothetical protein